jgi:hypothetical protein
MDAIHVKRERKRLQQIIRVQQAVIQDALALLSEQGYAEQRIIEAKRTLRKAVGLNDPD